jgi:hypothetical protein
MSLEEMERYESPELIKLFVVWDVDANFVLTETFLCCPKGITGEMYFADQIPHAVRTIVAESEFDDEAEELEGLDINPLEQTGTDADDEDHESND